LDTRKGRIGPKVKAKILAKAGHECGTSRTSEIKSQRQYLVQGGSKNKAEERVGNIRFQYHHQNGKVRISLG
jgi:hypothetical protein